MDQAHNPMDVSGLDVTVPGPQDVGVNTLRPDPGDEDPNMATSESENDGQYLVLPHLYDDGLNMGMPQSQDDHLNMADPLDNGLDPAVAKAVADTSECHSVLPLIKLELNTKIKLRRPNLTASTQPKPPPEMTAREKDQREKVRKRNKHHAIMSRIRRKEKENLLKEEIARYETENALLKEEVANSRGQIQVLKDVLHSHECLLEPPRDTLPA